MDQLSQNLVALNECIECSEGILYQHTNTLVKPWIFYLKDSLIVLIALAYGTDLYAI